jgi:hypothetical protein
VVLFPGFKETDHSTHVLERGIVGIGGIPVGLGVGGMGLLIIFPAISTNSKRS